MSVFQQLLASSGMTAEGIGARPAVLDAGTVPLDAEAVRIMALARKPECTDEFRLALSAYCRLREFDDEGNPNELRMAQALALRELLCVRGLFGPIPAGVGKTLIGMLAVTLLNSQRPVLLIPAFMVKDTRRDFATYRRNWKVRLPELVTYQEMGRPDRAKKWLELQPDLIVADEAQWLRNLDSAGARRFERYITEFRPIVVTMSGTLITDDPIDMHAPATWALGVNSPMPLDRDVAEQWSAALRQSGLKSVGTGSLDLLPGGFFEWLRNSRGVVSADGSGCEAQLIIERWRPVLPEPIKQLIAAVAVSGMRPDGELLDEWELPDCLCQLAMEFYYVWDPLPPPWWRTPRKSWRVYARAVLDERLPGFDSESQIVHALDAVKGSTAPPYAADGRARLAAWRAVRDQFVPNPVPVWLGDSVVKQIADLAHREPMIVWVKHKAAGWAMQHLGVPYYGGGTDPRSAPANRPIACSIQAHSEGKNLQAWYRANVTCPPADALRWEQLLAREHRPGQKNPWVHARIMETIGYHTDVIERVTTQAEAVAKASGFGQRLINATWTGV